MSPLRLFTLALAASAVANGWPPGHINRLSDIRCRQWCSFRFREVAGPLFSGRGAAAALSGDDVRRYLIGGYVKRTQDQPKVSIDQAVRENLKQFRAYYHRRGGEHDRLLGNKEEDRMTMRWFNVYHEYLHCLADCFDA